MLRDTEHQESISTVQKLEPPLLVLQSGLHDILHLWCFRIKEIKNAEVNLY
jgi:hypothetical protein